MRTGNGAVEEAGQTPGTGGSSKSGESQGLERWSLFFVFCKGEHIGLQAGGQVVAVPGVGHTLTSFSSPDLGTASSNGSPGPASSPSLASLDLELGTQRPESMQRCMWYFASCGEKKASR